MSTGIKKLFKRALVFILALPMIFSVALTSGCGDNDPGYTKGEDGEFSFTKPVVIRFATPEGQFGDEITAFAAGFKKLYPQVTIKHEPIAGDWTTKLLGQISGGTAPDIFWGNPFTYASKGALEPLDSYLEEFGMVKSDYYESMFRYGTYKGKLYMMPRDYNKVVVYYNSKIFDTVFNNGAYTGATLPFRYDPDKYAATGKFYPSNGWTWDEFTATAKAIVLKSGGNFVRRGADISLNWVSGGAVILEALGCTIRAEDASGNETVNFNNETNKQIIQTEILDRIADGSFVNTVLNDVGDFYGGKVGMVLNSRPIASNVQEKFGSEWDVVTFPLIDGNEIIPTGCSGYCLYANSKIKDLAARFLYYIASEEGQEIFSKTGNCTPILKEMCKDEDAAWRKYPRADLNHEAFVWGDSYDCLSYQFNFNNEDAVGNFEEYWGNTVVGLLNGDLNLTDALKYGQSELLKIFVR